MAEQQFNKQGGQQNDRNQQPKQGGQGQGAAWGNQQQQGGQGNPNQSRQDTE